MGNLSSILEDKLLLKKTDGYSYGIYTCDTAHAIVLTADCLMSQIFFLFGKYLHLKFYRVLLKAFNTNFYVISNVYNQYAIEV